MSDRRARRVPRPRRRSAAVVVLATLVAGLAAAVPDSGAALTASVTNSTNTVTTQAYFTCASAIMASSPRVYYKLDDATTATTAADSSGQGRAGAYQGTTTKGVADACLRDDGTAVTFNGTSGYVDLATSLSVPTTYSVSAWLRTTTTSGGLIAGFGAAATGSSTTTDRVLYMTNAGALAFGNNNAAKAAATAAGPYNDGSWHHVLATVGTSGMRIYVDGRQVASSTATASAAYTGYFRVGYDNLAGWPNAPTSSFFRGTLDEVAAFSTTLSGTDASNQYQAGI